MSFDISGCHGNMSSVGGRVSRFPGLTLLGRRWNRSLTFGSLGSMHRSTEMEKSANTKSVAIDLGDTDRLSGVTPEPQPIMILGADLGGLPQSAQFLICCSGVFFFYLIYGYIQVSVNCIPQLFYCRQLILVESSNCNDDLGQYILNCYHDII